MKKLTPIALLTFAPSALLPMSIKVDIDVNIMNGDGTLNSGDKNSSSEERVESGSSREDSSESSREVSTLIGKAEVTN